MVVGERITPLSPNTIPFEIQGVCIVESSTKKQFYFTDFTQQQIDLLMSARETREQLSPIAAQSSTLARIFYSQALLPWGPLLQKREESERMIAKTIIAIDNLTAAHTRLRNHSYHKITLEKIDEIRRDLEEFSGQVHS